MSTRLNDSPRTRAASPARRALLALLAAGGVAGCNALFGIDEVELAGEGGSAGASAGGASGAAGRPVGPGGGAGGAIGVGGASGAGAAGAVVTCAGTETACDARCVDLAVAKTDCGACGHDCGGGDCQLGACQPVAIDLKTTQVVSNVAIGPSEIYFSTSSAAPYGLFACPHEGCTLAPRQLVSMTYPILGLAYAAGAVAFESAPAQTTQRPAVFACPETGCAGTPTSLASDGLNGFVGHLFAVGPSVYYNGGGIGVGRITCAAGVCGEGQTLLDNGLDAVSADATRFAFVDNAANGRRLATCELANGVCGAPVELVPGDHSAVKATQLYGDTFYYMEPGREDFFEGELKACSLADQCATGPVNLARGLDFPTTLLVDASGSYWFSRTNPALLQHCAPDACTGGAKALATGLAAPRSLTTDDRFVYWVSGGAAFRVAKPLDGAPPAARSPWAGAPPAARSP